LWEVDLSAEIITSRAEERKRRKARQLQESKASYFELISSNPPKIVGSLKDALVTSQPILRPTIKTKPNRAKVKEKVAEDSNFGIAPYVDQSPSIGRGNKKNSSDPPQEVQGDKDLKSVLTQQWDEGASHVLLFTSKEPQSYVPSKRKKPVRRQKPTASVDSLEEDKS
jgi:hypothetical protein